MVLALVIDIFYFFVRQVVVVLVEEEVVAAAADGAAVKQPLVGIVGQHRESRERRVRPAHELQQSAPKL
jgi:hypothetical protein